MKDPGQTTDILTLKTFPIKKTSYNEMKMHLHYFLETNNRVKALLVMKKIFETYSVSKMIQSIVEYYYERANGNNLLFIPKCMKYYIQIENLLKRSKKREFTIYIQNRCIDLISQIVCGDHELTIESRIRTILTPEKIKEIKEMEAQIIRKSVKMMGFSKPQRNLVLLKHYLKKVCSNNDPVHMEINRACALYYLRGNMKISLHLMRWMKTVVTDPTLEKHIGIHLKMLGSKEFSFSNHTQYDALNFMILISNEINSVKTQRKNFDMDVLTNIVGFK